jgi:hypothetical protein
MSPARFAACALALPDAVAGGHQGHPDFRVAGRVFATLHPDGATAMVRVPPAVQRRLVGAPGVKPATGAWGRAGCTLLALGEVDEAFARMALLEAWQAAVAAARPGRKGPRGGSGRAAKRPRG